MFKMYFGWIDGGDENAAKYVKFYLPLTNEAVDFLKDLRKKATQDREEFLNIQKELGKQLRDLETMPINMNVKELKNTFEQIELVKEALKLMKDKAAEQMKLFRAIEFWLGEITGENKKQMNKELAPYADHIQGRLMEY